MLNSEQPHLDENSLRLTMGCNDRIGMWQKSHTAQSESACQTILIARLTLACAELATQITNSSRQPSTECPLIESANADDQMHFTPIRQENCDSKKAGQRPSMVCDSVPQGRLSRSEWRTVDPVAQRSGLCWSNNPRQTCLTPPLYDVASHEAVKFNATVNRAAANQH